mmetsp:Transcript_674/g.2243  ORF Transcript_674/g.2243 Transcript_674/m.2243 type:complete len:395 (+) Transcript_674:1237-2421(+)
MLVPLAAVVEVDVCIVRRGRQRPAVRGVLDGVDGLRAVLGLEEGLECVLPQHDQLAALAAHRDVVHVVREGHVREADGAALETHGAGADDLPRHRVPQEDAGALASRGEDVRLKRVPGDVVEVRSVAVHAALGPLLARLVLPHVASVCADRDTLAARHDGAVDGAEPRGGFALVRGLDLDRGAPQPPVLDGAVGDIPELHGTIGARGNEGGHVGLEAEAADAAVRLPAVVLDDHGALVVRLDAAHALGPVLPDVYLPTRVAGEQRGAPPRLGGQEARAHHVLHGHLPKEQRHGHPLVVVVHGPHLDVLGAVRHELLALAPAVPDDAVHLGRVPLGALALPDLLLLRPVPNLHRVLVVRTHDRELVSAGTEGAGDGGAQGPVDLEPAHLQPPAPQ